MIGSSVVGVVAGLLLAIFGFWSAKNPKPLQHFFTTPSKRRKRGFIVWSLGRTRLFAGTSGVFGVCMTIAFVAQLIRELQ